MKLHPYQERAVNFALRVGKSFQMLDCGLGKTAIALMMARKMKLPTLVFAPLRPALMSWPEEIYKWTPELSFTLLHGPNKDKRLRLKKDIYIVPYSSLKWFYQNCVGGRFELRKFYTIFDESSFFKEASTQRFKMLKDMSKMFSNYYRMNLSATPATSGLQDLWSQYYMLDEGKRLGRRVTHYLNNYFTVTGPPRYQTIIHTGSEQKIYKKVKDITYRLKGTDYIDMPTLVYNKIEIELPDKLKTMYKRMKDEMQIEIGGQTVIAPSSPILNNKLRQFLQGAMYTTHPDYKLLHKEKVNVLRELMETNAGKPILCAIQFKFEHKVIEEALGTQVPIIHGNTSTDLSLAYLAEWNKGNIPLLLCHPQSMSHGLNLQTGGSIVVWMALPWSLDHYHQLNGRLYRQGQDKGVVIHHIMFRNTMDQRVMRVLQMRHATQNDLLEALKQEVKLAA